MRLVVGTGRRGGGGRRRGEDVSLDAALCGGDREVRLVMGRSARVTAI